MPTCAVISQKQLGDTLLLEPAAAALAARSGQDTILLTKPAFAPLVRRMPSARPPAPGETIDEVWVFEHGSKASLAAWRCRRARRHLRLLRQSYRRWYHPLVFHDRTAEPLRYEFRALSHFRAVTGGDEGFRPPRLDPPPRPRSARLPADAILLNPTSAWRSKAWIPERWAALARELIRSTSSPVVLIGQGDDWMEAHVRAILDNTPDTLVNLFNATTLEELLTLIAHARAMVSVDGAPAHIAAAFDVPGLTLFGPTRAEEWHWPGHARLALKTSDLPGGERRHLDGLPLDLVLDKTHALLHTAHRANPTSPPNQPSPQARPA